MSKLMTWVMPSTSMPRAAMSVATSVRISPERNSANVRSRWFCDLLPWMALAAMPALSSVFTTLSAPCLVRVKTSARLIGSFFRSLVRTAGLAEKSIWRTRWLIRSAVEDTGVTATRAGSRSMASASSAMSFGIVAGQCQRDGLGLDGGGCDVLLFGESARDRFGEAEILKRSQKMGSFHVKYERPAQSAGHAREGVEKTPACLGCRMA